MDEDSDPFAPAQPRIERPSQLISRPLIVQSLYQGQLPTSTVSDPSSPAIIAASNTRGSYPDNRPNPIHDPQTIDKPGELVYQTEQFAKKSELAIISLQQWLASRQTSPIPAETCVTAILSEHGSGDDQIFEYLVIGSSALLNEISRVTGHYVPQHSNVFLRPFKLFSHNRERLLARLEDLNRASPRPASAASVSDKQDNEDNEKSASQNDPHIPTGTSGDDKPAKPRNPFPEPESEEMQATKRLAAELSCLCDFISLYIPTNYGASDDAECYFADLWHIFRPGLRVWSHLSPKMIHCVVSISGVVPGCKLGRKKEPQPGIGNLHLKRTWMPLVLNCFHLECDGISLGPVAEQYIIQPYDGLRSLTSLDVFPLHLKISFHETVRKRGAKFRDLMMTPRKERWYRGTERSIEERCDGEINLATPVIIDQAMVYSNSSLRPVFEDNQQVRSIVGGNLDQRATEGDFEPRAIDNVYDDSSVDMERAKTFLDTNYEYKIRPITELTEIPDRWLELLPSRLWAYLMNVHRWALVDLDCIESYPRPPEDLVDFHDIILSENKMALKAYATAYSRGFGLSQVHSTILLFHGPPGLGKTSTAVALSVMIDCPLFVILPEHLDVSSGQAVSTRMRELLSLAARWRSVVFIKNIDVLLSSRRPADTNHNCVVSAILNVLDSYSGLVILSTTRTGDLDEGLISRLDSSFYFPPLLIGDAQKILQSELTRFMSSQTEKWRDLRISAESDGMREALADMWYRGYRLHGRQIRNTVQSSLALALLEPTADDTGSAKGTLLKEIKLRVEHFRAAADTHASFSKYLALARGTNDEDLALQLGLRMDTFDTRSSTNIRMGAPIAATNPSFDQRSAPQALGQWHNPPPAGFTEYSSPQPGYQTPAPGSMHHSYATSSYLQAQIPPSIITQPISGFSQQPERSTPGPSFGEDWGRRQT